MTNKVRISTAHKLLPHMLVPCLSLSLLISWGSLYYSFAILSESMQRTLNCSAESVTGAFSLSLLFWGLSTYPVGLIVQRWGARIVMVLGSLLAAVGFWGLQSTTSIYGFYFMWVVLGISMALILYESAFAFIVQHFTDRHRQRIGWLSIVGGLASTVFWPLSYWLNSTIGWENTVIVFALLQLLVCLPIHLILPSARQDQLKPDLEHLELLEQRNGNKKKESNYLPFVQLATCFAIYGFIVAAISVQVIPILKLYGIDTATALTLAASIGPMQALGRAIDLWAGSRWTARSVGIITLGLMPLSIIALWLTQWNHIFGIVFALSYGLSLGLLTVVKATSPLDILGSKTYALHSGALGAPSVIARAMGPIGAAWLFSSTGSYDVLLLTLLTTALIGTFLYIRTWSSAKRSI